MENTFEELTKIKRGKFFTRNANWLQPQVLEFIKQTHSTTCYDPFAGGGDLLKLKDVYGLDFMFGLDIDPMLGWRTNDSLVKIPHLDNAIIITNPPYLAKNSTSIKGMMPELSTYFNNTIYDDLYLVALDRMLEAQDNIVAIVPETFINSKYKQKDRLVSITVLEDNPFVDTKTPVCVVCFDARKKSTDEIKIYKNDLYLFTLKDLNKKRKLPQNDLKVKFNDINGWLALRAIDSTNPEQKISFGLPTNFKYDWLNKINVNSRSFTLISVDIPKEKRNKFIEKCNEILNTLRSSTFDICLSPFKCNMTNGIRRRRLDFKTARAIIELAFKSYEK